MRLTPEECRRFKTTFAEFGGNGTSTAIIAGVAERAKLPEIARIFRDVTREFQSDYFVGTPFEGEV